MIRAAEALMMFSLFLVVFFAGVNYSDAVKGKASWLFEKEEVEVDITNMKQQDIEEAQVEEEVAPSIYEDFESEIANKQHEPVPVIPNH